MKLTIRKATLQDAEIIVKFNKAMALETEDKLLDDDTLTKGVNQLFDGLVKLPAPDCRHPPIVRFFVVFCGFRAYTAWSNK